MPQHKRNEEVVIQCPAMKHCPLGHAGLVVVYFSKGFCVYLGLLGGHLASGSVSDVIKLVAMFVEMPGHIRKTCCCFFTVSCSVALSFSVIFEVIFLYNQMWLFLLFF